MQGIYIRGARPKSKKEVRMAVLNNPELVTVEATSLFGNEFGGTAAELPATEKVHFVGPDPYTNRKFYGTIRHGKAGLVVD